MNVATSRARDGMLVFAGVESIINLQPQKRPNITQYLQFYQRRGWVKSIKLNTTSPYLPVTFSTTYKLPLRAPIDWSLLTDEVAAAGWTDVETVEPDTSTTIKNIEPDAPAATADITIEDNEATSVTTEPHIKPHASTATIHNADENTTVDLVPTATPTGPISTVNMAQGDGNSIEGTDTSTADKTSTISPSVPDPDTHKTTTVESKMSKGKGKGKYDEEGW